MKEIFAEKLSKIKIDGVKRDCYACIIDGDPYLLINLMFAEGMKVILINHKSIIPAWRIIQTIRLMGTFDDPNRLVGYFTSEINREIKDESIDQKIYDEVMNEPIPERIVLATLEYADPINIMTLRAEVMAGKAAYIPEMEKYGITDPVKEIEREDAIILRLKPLIKSYTKFINLENDDGLVFIEGRVISIVRKLDNADEFCDEAIVVKAGVDSFYICAEKGLSALSISGSIKPTNFKYAMSKSIDWMAREKGWSRDIVVAYLNLLNEKL